MVKRSVAIYRYELPPGTRAIGISRDTNLYNGLDNYFFGKPREQDVFSNNTQVYGPAFVCGRCFFGGR